MFNKVSTLVLKNLSLKELKALREQFITKMMVLGLEVIGFFGIPALLAVWLIKTQDLVGVVRFGVFAFAFALSWVLFLKRVRMVSAYIKAIEVSIEEKQLLIRSGHDKVDAQKRSIKQE